MRFERTIEDLKLMAAYVAQLTREGVTFKISDNGNWIEISLTGGY